MISLFLDTCIEDVNVCICKDNKILSCHNCKNENNLSESLLPIIDKISVENNIDINDIDKIIVANGPGSFTGVRIGVTVAKVMAWGLGKPIIPVSELFVLSTTKTDKKYIVPFIDARRGFVYAAMYDKNGKCLLKDQYIKFEKLMELIKDISPLENIAFVSHNDIYIPNVIVPNIDIEKILVSLKNVKGVNPHSLKPNYLKLTEAEEKLNDKRN